MSRLTSSVLIQFSPDASSEGSESDPATHLELSLVTRLLGGTQWSRVTGDGLAKSLTIAFGNADLCRRLRLIGVIPEGHAPLILNSASYSGPLGACYTGPGAPPVCLYSAPIEGIDSALSIGFPDENLYPFFVWPAGDFGYDPPLQAGEGNSAPPEWASELLSLHNAERVAPLAWSQVLAGIAQSHIDWCAAHGVLSHTGEEGRTTAERAAEAGYPYSVAENLVRGTIGDGAMQVWLADNEARSHIIDEGLTSVGFARALGTGDWADQWYVGALYGERHTSDVMAALELSALEGLDPDAEPRGVRLPMRLFIKRPGQTGEIEFQKLNYDRSPAFSGSGDSVSCKLPGTAVPTDGVWRVTGEDMAAVLPDSTAEHVDVELWWRIYLGSGDMVYKAQCNGSTLDETYRSRRNAGIDGGLGIFATTDFKVADIVCQPPPHPFWLKDNPPWTFSSGATRRNARLPTETHGVWTGVDHQNRPLALSWFLNNVYLDDSLIYTAPFSIRALGATVVDVDDAPVLELWFMSKLSGAIYRHRLIPDGQIEQVLLVDTGSVSYSARGWQFSQDCTKIACYTTILQTGLLLSLKAFDSPGKVWLLDLTAGSSFVEQPLPVPAEITTPVLSREETIEESTQVLKRLVRAFEYDVSSVAGIRFDNNVLRIRTVRIKGKFDADSDARNSYVEASEFGELYHVERIHTHSTTEDLFIYDGSALIDEVRLSAHSLKISTEYEIQNDDGVILSPAPGRQGWPYKETKTIYWKAPPDYIEQAYVRDFFWDNYSIFVEVEEEPVFREVIIPIGHAVPYTSRQDIFAHVVFDMDDAIHYQYKFLEDIPPGQLISGAENVTVETAEFVWTCLTKTPGIGYNTVFQNSSGFLYGGFYTHPANGEILYEMSGQLADGIPETYNPLYIIFDQGDFQSKATGKINNTTVITDHTSQRERPTGFSHFNFRYFLETFEERPDSADVGNYILFRDTYRGIIENLFISLFDNSKVTAQTFNGQSAMMIRNKDTTTTYVDGSVLMEDESPDAPLLSGVLSPYRCLIKPPPEREPTPPGGDPPAVSALLAAHNAERADAGLPPLSLSSELSDAAMAHIVWCEEQGNLSHVGAGGSMPTDRAQAAGYIGVAVENLAARQLVVSDVMAAWMNSPGHRANILRADGYVDFGAGIISSTHWGGFAWCVLIGRPT